MIIWGPLQAGSDQVLDVQLNAGPPHVVMLAMMHTLKELREQLLIGGILTAKGRVQLSIPTQASVGKPIGSLGCCFCKCGKEG